jgi:hypothetical protein
MRALLPLVLATLAGCFVAPPPPPVRPLAADGPIAHVRVGMGTADVERLLGRPDDVHESDLLKPTDPLYGASDHRVVHHYRSVGRVVFGRNPRNPTLHVIRVEGDRYEPGVFRPAPDGATRTPE